MERGGAYTLLCMVFPYYSDVCLDDFLFLAFQIYIEEMQPDGVGALQIAYDLFGAEGKNGGGISGGTIGGSYDLLLSGDALMSVFTLVGMEDRLLANSDRLAVMPLSNLFTDSEGESARRIPAHTISLSYYRYASAVSNTQLCAAALFTDYLSSHSYKLAEYGLIPMRKSVLESDEYVNSANPTVNLIKQYGDPDDFFTIDGYKYAKEIVNKVCAEKYLLPFLETDGKVVAETIESWTRSYGSMAIGYKKRECWHLHMTKRNYFSRLGGIV